MQNLISIRGAKAPADPPGGGYILFFYILLNKTNKVNIRESFIMVTHIMDGIF